MDKAMQAAIDFYRPRMAQSDAARLDFFRALWEALDEADAAACTIAAAHFEAPDALKLRELSQAGIPVFSEAPVRIDAPSLVRGTKALVACAVDKGGFTQELTDALSSINWDDVLSADSLELAGSKPGAYLGVLEEELSSRGASPASTRVATLLVSLALREQLKAPATAVQQARKKAGLASDHQRTCPVCGAEAALGRVGEGEGSDGRGKTLWCPQCASTWAFDRIRCVRCGTHNQAHLHYFNIEGDETHRIATCDECGGYVRVRFDDAHSHAPLSYEVEDVVMARLDALANSPSFASAQEAARE